MEEGPAVTYPAPDLENLKEVTKQDKYMKDVYQKELGDTRIFINSSRFL